MKLIVKVMILVVAVTVVGYEVNTKLKNASYGIAESTPLGTFEQLDTYLTETIGLIKSEVSTAPARDVSATARMFSFANRENEYDRITLLLDRSDTLVGIVGLYWVDDFGTRSPAMLFAQSYWRRLGGAREPEFTGVVRGNATYSDASFQAERVSGAWKVLDVEGQREVIIHLRPR